MEDASTATLMSRFYENLQTMSKAEALRQAQLALVRRGQTAGPTRDVAIQHGGVPAASAKDPLSHPYFWAPFVLVGDGQ